MPEAPARKNMAMQSETFRRLMEAFCRDRVYVFDPHKSDQAYVQPDTEGDITDIVVAIVGQNGGIMTLPLHAVQIDISLGALISVLDDLDDMMLAIRSSFLSLGEVVTQAMEDHWRDQFEQHAQDLVRTAAYIDVNYTPYIEASYRATRSCQEMLRKHFSERAQHD